MTSHKIIPPLFEEEEFYEYLFSIWTMSEHKENIPTQFYKDLIQYFEETENYERCTELVKLIKDRDDF